MTDPLADATPAAPDPYAPLEGARPCPLCEAAPSVERSHHWTGRRWDLIQINVRCRRHGQLLAAWGVSEAFVLCLWNEKVASISLSLGMLGVDGTP